MFKQFNNNVFICDFLQGVQFDKSTMYTYKNIIKENYLYKKIRLFYF